LEAARRRKGLPGATIPWGTLTEAARMKSKLEKRKQSLYFPVEMLDEMQKEAERLERPISWVIQQAWKLSKDAIGNYPGVNDMPNVAA
jgi:uncharacterized small protein (TIGR04563 family)